MTKGNSDFYMMAWIICGQYRGRLTNFYCHQHIFLPLSTPLTTY